ncbi:MAG: hypothetical protein ACRETW_04640 [Stenotrophobium sp.]
MDALKIVAILLIATGGFGVAYGGFSYIEEIRQADTGSMQFAVAEQQHVNIPLWAGIGAIIGGVLLLLPSRKA